MTKYVKQFLHRGLVFGGFGPIVAGIIYAILQSTIEYLFATYARNSEFSDNVIYVGPMGCQTGFFLVSNERIFYSTFDKKSLRRGFLGLEKNSSG